MIVKGMDVKELVNSDLFYPPIWKKSSIFSEQQKPKIIAYHNDLEDLEYESPQNLMDNESKWSRRFLCFGREDEIKNSLRSSRRANTTEILEPQSKKNKKGERTE